MNSVIENIFDGFTVDGSKIPVSFMFYDGHEDTYITYQNSDTDNSYSGDDDLLGYVVYYDFDIYSKGDYFNIIKSVKELLKANNFEWQASRTSPDFYENDTGYYHKTLCFAYLKEDD